MSRTHIFQSLVSHINGVMVYNPTKDLVSIGYSLCHVKIVECRNAICYKTRGQQFHTTWTVYVKGVASLTDTVAWSARLNLLKYLDNVRTLHPDGRHDEVNVQDRRQTFTIACEVTVSVKEDTPFAYTVLVGWLVELMNYVASVVFQQYRDLEVGDNQSLKIQVARTGNEPLSSCSASQELNHSATAAPHRFSSEDSLLHQS